MGSNDALAFKMHPLPRQTLEDKDLEKAIFHILLLEVMAPALAELPMVDIQEVSQEFRKETVRYLRHHHGASGFTIEKHLRVSKRWIYGLGMEKSESENKHAIFMSILTLFTQNYPTIFTAEEVRKALRRQNWQLSLIATTNLLVLYCQFGRLEACEGGYRAPEAQRILYDEVVEESSKKIATRLKPLPAICTSFARADPGALCGSLKGEVYEDCFEAMSAEIREVVAAVVQKHTHKTTDAESSSGRKFIQFEGFVLLGQTPRRKPRENDVCPESKMQQESGQLSTSSSSSSEQLDEKATLK